MEFSAISSTSEQPDGKSEHQRKFEKKICEMVKEGKNRALFSKEQLQKYINEVIIAKSKGKSTKTSREYNLLATYDTLSLFGTIKLVECDEDKKRSIKRKKTSTSTTAIVLNKQPRYYVHQWELFHTILNSHLAVGHGGEKRTYVHVRNNVANITFQQVKLFISLCNACNLKHIPRHKKKIVKPIVSENFGERGQIDLIDMRNENDSHYKYILHYQDHLTKFSILRALPNKETITIAHQLLDIFTTIGAPKTLQSDNGLEFVSEVIRELTTNLWPDLLIVHGKPRHPQSQGSVERGNGDVIEVSIKSFLFFFLK